MEAGPLGITGRARGTSLGQHTAPRRSRLGFALGFTLIELLVILTIIAMILTMAMPSIVGLVRSSRIGATTDILQAAVSYTRSTAIGTNRSSTLDLANSETGEETEALLVSTIVVFDDFERYPTNPVALEQHFEENELWEVDPSLGETGWLVVTDQTRELRAGRRTGYVRNAYAWNLNTESPAEPDIDAVSIAQARFRVVGPGPADSPDPWGFGILTNLRRSRSQCMGYRLAVRGKTDEEGFSAFSEVVLEKLYASSSAARDRPIEAEDPPLNVSFTRDIDQPGVTAIVTSGVWYWLKLETKRQKGVVEVVGKFWIGEAADEPDRPTVGPALDAFPDADLKGRTDNFREDPAAGGCCGVWADGAEISVDDFTIASEQGWHLPAKILLWAEGSGGEKLDRFTAGGFPLSYLPDGSSQQSVAVNVTIMDITTAKRRKVRIDNSGKVGD